MTFGAQFRGFRKVVRSTISAECRIAHSSRIRCSLYAIADASSDCVILRRAIEPCLLRDNLKGQRHCQVVYAQHPVCGGILPPRCASTPSERNRVLREVTMYQGRTPRVLNTSLALIALAFAVCKVASASGTGASPIFSYPEFSGSSSVHPTGTVAISGSQVHLTDGSSHNGGGLWYNTVQNIQSFTTTFTFQLPGIDGYGMFFVIQNSNSTTNPGYSGLSAGGNSANGMGYG